MATGGSEVVIVSALEGIELLFGVEDREETRSDFSDRELWPVRKKVSPPDAFTVLCKRREERCDTANIALNTGSRSSL